MDTGEALDRELIVERAEELRAWLGGLGLSGRTYGPLERELSGILANDPGSYINGQRPLAGMTVDDFIGAIHSRNGGAVGKVKSVGDAALRELRETIEPIVPVDAPAAAPEPAAPELELPDLEEPAPEPVAPAAEAPPAPRRRGRPKGSTSARNGAAPSRNGVTASAEQAAEPAPRRRGRPRRSEQAAASPRAAAPAPAPQAAPPRAAASADAPPRDAALDQLVRLWPELHPHARRAVVLYASALIAEAGVEG